MSDFNERKKARKEYYEKFVKGWKLRDCVACMGTGKYDNFGSPSCSACDGKGKVRVKIISSEKCKSCSGSGFMKNSRFHKCSSCLGKGIKEVISY